MFLNRTEAGRKLASALKEFHEKDVIILAIPRGGVVVGAEVAKALNCELDIVVPRKIGAPFQPELAVGAVSEDGTVVVDEEVAKDAGVSSQEIERIGRRELEEVQRRVAKFRGERPLPDLKDRIVMIVDDGIATGSTVRAAMASARARGARSIVVAVPVAPRESVQRLSKEADRVVCLDTPAPFYAIGEFYVDFEQVEDEEVVRLLSERSKNVWRGSEAHTE